MHVIVSFHNNWVTGSILYSLKVHLLNPNRDQTRWKWISQPPQVDILITDRLYMTPAATHLDTILAQIHNLATRYWQCYQDLKIPRRNLHLECRPFPLILNIYCDVKMTSFIGLIYCLRMHHPLSSGYLSVDIIPYQVFVSIPFIGNIFVLELIYWYIQYKIQWLVRAGSCMKLQYDHRYFL